MLGSESRIATLEDGFSLIEVLVALTIFAIGLLALASMQMTAINGNAISQRLTTETSVAEGVMEWLQSLPATDPIFDTATTAAQVTNPPFDANGKVNLKGGGVLTATYDIIPDPPPGTGSGWFPASVVRINVNVTSSVSSMSPVRLTSLKWVR